MGVWLCMQCVCGVGVMYCVSVHVFVHAWGKQITNKKINVDNMSAGKRLKVCLLMDSNPCALPSACDSTVLSPGMVIDTHNHIQPRCMLESWHIQHQQSPLTREKGTLPGLYAALLT